MATQTTYSSNLAAAVPGAQASEIPATILSRTVETAAGIGFGVAVEQGAADKGCIIFDGGTVLGITVLDRGATGEDEFAQYESARVMVKGDIWVTCATGCSAGDGVFVRPSNGDFQDSSANSGVQIPNARWETSAGAGELAVIRLG
ncbi:MAG: structural cement protein Gp24 [Sinimarinibacterium flocculans]|uniref:structural cement protein Gp24 n=1 Tax=Sinimarinibacterium flocculans TaxID=985250 RepID=UPI003C502A83